MLAHFLARFDGGNYVKIVVDGDPHSYHQQLAELPTRDNAKTFIYGFIYGAGDEKIGLIVGKGAAVGRKLRFTFLKKFPALDQLKNAVAAKAKMYGTIKALDGRALYVRAIYSSLNTLLQSAGALVMKMAVVLFNREIRKRGWFQSGAVRQVAFVHDEIQSIVREDLVEEVKQLKVECIRKAGEHFGLRCPTDGDAKHGNSWGDTH
jgi:DNA polymerase I-like protein with 3'-5' exonuclease and polymerase domains